MLIQLVDAARSVAGDSDLRVVILTGAGDRGAHARNRRSPRHRPDR